MTKYITKRENFLKDLFQQLEQQGIKYVIPCSYENLPYEVVTDVDFYILERDIEKIDYLITELSSRHQFTLVQKTHNGYKLWYYELVFMLSPNYSVNLDFAVHLAPARYVFLLSNEQLLANRQKYNCFYIPPPCTEFLYMLFKRIYSNNIEYRHIKHLKHLLLQAPQIDCELCKYFSASLASDIKGWILSQDLKSFQNHISVLRKKLLHRMIFRCPCRSIRYLLGELVRYAKRFLLPTGLLVVLIGPDGSGKTSVGNALCKQVLSGFRRTKHIHWRPGLLPPLSKLLHRRNGLGEDYTQPHRAEPYGGFVSLLRFFYYAIDFIIGYLLKIQILKAKSTLVVIDRYYYDYLVDARRYRLKLSQRLIHIVMNMIPKPDIVVYLHNSPENLYARKQEITMEEITRQVGKFQEILSKLPNAYKVDTNKSLEKVIHEVTSIILDFMAQRVKKTLGVMQNG